MQEDKLTIFEEQILDLIYKCRDASSIWEPTVVKQLRQIIPSICGSKKQKLIKEIKNRLKTANDTQQVDIYDDYWLGGRGSAFEECVEVIEEILSE